MSNTLPILGKRRRIRYESIPISDLKFMTDNPRIYTASSKTDRTQTLIKELLQGKDYVKALKKDIERHDGVQDPLTILELEEDKMVLDGNGRLAALHLLYYDEGETHQERWRTAPCIVIEESLDQEEIFSLLCQRHITGQAEWESYEQANLFYVQHEEHELSIETLKHGSGLSVQKIKRLIEAIQEMKDNEDNNRDHWSHYHEVLLGTKAIRDGCSTHQGLKKRLLRIIKNEHISAQDLRKKMPIILKGSKQNLRRFIAGRRSLDGAYDVAEGSGKLTDRVKKFLVWLSDDNTKKDIAKAHTAEKNKFIYHIKKAKREIIRILENLPDTNSKD